MPPRCKRRQVAQHVQPPNPPPPSFSSLQQQQDDPLASHTINTQPSQPHSQLQPSSSFPPHLLNPPQLPILSASLMSPQLQPAVPCNPLLAGAGSSGPFNRQQPAYNSMPGPLAISQGATEAQETEGESQEELGEDEEGWTWPGVCAKRGRAPPQPPQPDPLQTALRQFAEVAPSITSSLAQEALQDALDKNADLRAAMDAHKQAHTKRKPQAPTFRDNLSWWIEEAQTQLACRNEFDAETSDLEQAMAASLREAQAERLRQEAEEQQLGQAAALERKFGESPILKELSSVCQVSVLACFSSASKPLQKLLSLEKKCKHWYTGRGTFVYFESAARELAQHLRKAASQQGITQLPIECAPSQSNTPSGSKEAAQLVSPDRLDGKAASCLEQLATELEERESLLQTELARMPDDANGAVYVPKVFRLPPGMDEREVVDVCSDDDGER